MICLLPDLSVIMFRRVFMKNPIDHAMALEQQEQVHRLKRKKTGANELEDTVVIEAKPLCRNDSPVRRIPSKVQAKEETKMRPPADETSSVLPSVGGQKPKSKKESSQGLMNKPSLVTDEGFLSGVMGEDDNETNKRRRRRRRETSKRSKKDTV